MPFSDPLLYKELYHMIGNMEYGICQAGRLLTDPIFLDRIPDPYPLKNWFGFRILIHLHFWIADPIRSDLPFGSKGTNNFFVGTLV
jgi:hypothetical protein